jgi:hypothetical protein
LCRVLPVGTRHTYENKGIMGATNSFESENLRHLLLNENIPDIGDAAGLPPSATPGSVYICLLTQDPGEPGDITNEAVYTPYARIAVPRGVTGWVEANGTIQNIADLDFAQATGGSETITHWGICKTLAGDDMVFHGVLPSPFLMSVELQPRIPTGQLALNMN